MFNLCGLNYRAVQTASSSRIPVQPARCLLFFLLDFKLAFLLLWIKRLVLLKVSYPIASSQSKPQKYLEKKNSWRTFQNSTTMSGKDNVKSSVRKQSAIPWFLSVNHLKNTSADPKNACWRFCAPLHLSWVELDWLNYTSRTMLSHSEIMVTRSAYRTELYHVVW